MTLGSFAPWLVFGAAVAVLLFIDLRVVARRHPVMPTRIAVLWSAIWIGLGLLFSLAVWGWRGATAAQEYLAGYLIEESLSVDNLFVFLLVFGSLGIALRYQRRVLLWGILGAIVMRGIFIFAGVHLLDRFHWIIYVFGALLVVTAVRLLFSSGVHVDPERNVAVRLVRRVVPLQPDYVGSAFTIKQAGRRMLTPLAIALVTIEGADLVFAIDSVPAVLAVSTDTFVVFTSNIAAILGLRSLYFALAHALYRFEHLKWGLAIVLGFVGAKMLLSDVVHIPIYVSLAVIVATIGGAVCTSLWVTRDRSGDDAASPGSHAGDDRGGSGRPSARKHETLVTRDEGCDG